MQKINFQDLPNTNTPINASNLNLLQSNIENWLIGSRINNVDLNDYKTTGVYYFGTNLTNAPKTFMYCLVVGSGSEPVFQLGFNMGGTINMYFRVFANNAWSDWNLVTSSSVQ